MAPEPSSAEGDGGTLDAAAVARGLLSSIASERIAAALATRGVPLMVLKGAPVQRRLLGQEAAYPSADVDLLVPRRDGRRARALLHSEGWRFLPENGLLWRIDRAAAFHQRGLVVDLHWGLHLGTLPAWVLRPLERALWEGARRAEEGWWEPRVEPLVVYLCLHAAAFGYTKPAGLRLVAAAASQVEDWDEVEGLGRRLGAWPIVAHALARVGGDAEQPAPRLLVGVRGRLMTATAVLLRRAPLPAPAARAARATRSWWAGRSDDSA